MCHLLVKSVGISAVLLTMLAQGCNQSSGSSQNTNQRGGPQTFVDAQSAASESLATFRSLVSSQNYKELGFDSPDEVNRATLSEPLHVYLVKLDRLREYQPGSDANTLLDDANQLYYPVNVGTQVRTSITVGQTAGKWRPESFGNAGLARQIAEVRKASSGVPPTASSSDMIVQIQALGLYFIGRRNADNRLMLISLADNPVYNFKAGSTQSAEEVFAALLPAAKNYNGLPM